MILSMRFKRFYVEMITTEKHKQEREIRGKEGIEI